MIILREIIIPNYIRHAKLSESQKPVYYHYDGVTLRSKKTSKLPNKFIKTEFIEVAETLSYFNLIWLKPEYSIGVFKKDVRLLITKDSAILKPLLDKPLLKFLLIDKDNLPVIANSKTMGTPKLFPINGQSLYNGAMREHIRGSVMQQIKESFIPYVKNIEMLNRKDYPIRVLPYLFDEIGTGNWDIGNRSLLYNKAFLDLLRTGETGKTKINEKKEKEYIKYFAPKIEEDSIIRVTQEGGTTFVPIESSLNSKLIFRIVKDERDVLKNFAKYLQ